MTKLNLRRFTALFLLVLGALMLATFVPKNTYATTSLQGTDFQAKSFSKTVDYYDYVRQYAAANNINYTLNQNQHAYIYTTYINVGSFQLFYARLLNATHNNMNVTIPIQTVFEHFKTPQGKDAITASSFLSLVAFRENGTSDIFPNSPDRNDTVFASFSLGYALSAFGTHPVPTYVANTQIIPLTATPRGLHFNATGTYYLSGLLRGTQTIYQYLAQNGYKLSIVQSHMAVLASTNTSDTTDSGSSVDNNVESDVARTGVNTVASD